jgi:hypothetical protein
MPQPIDPAEGPDDGRKRLGAVLWAAFLAACVATMLFFAVFDPLLLMDDDAPPSWLADRRSGYALGFFFFWATSTLAAALTAWLVMNPRHGAVDG